MGEVIYTAFHGTDKESAKSILSQNSFTQSDNDDDWLGRGVYFYTNIDNAILYNIRQFINDYKLYPNYKELSKERKILLAQIECDSEDIFDLNDIENMGKFLGLWKIFYERVKENPKYKNVKYKDGYMINWLFDNTDYFDGCKVILNIFMLDLKFHRKINEIFNNKTRIGYMLQQEFICVVDNNCIRSVEIYNKNYQNEYNIIKDLTNNILMVGDKDEN